MVGILVEVYLAFSLHITTPVLSVYSTLNSKTFGLSNRTKALIVDWLTFFDTSMGFAHAHLLIIKAFYKPMVLPHLMRLRSYQLCITACGGCYPRRIRWLRIPSRLWLLLKRERV